MKTPAPNSDAIAPSPIKSDRRKMANIKKFQHFCDPIAGRAAKQGMSEEKLTALLANDE